YAVDRRRAAGDDRHVVGTGEARNDALSDRAEPCLHETGDVGYDSLFEGLIEIRGIAAVIAHDDDRPVRPAILYAVEMNRRTLARCHFPALASSLAAPGRWNMLHRCLRSLPMAQSPAEVSVIKAYWQPGCTSCLRMKEFLTKHGVPFVSVNVLEDKDAFAELAALGIRSVPIVRRGTDWANGQVLRDVARVAGIAWGGARVLPARDLVARLIEIQMAAQRLFAQIPEDRLGRMLPPPPRSYAPLRHPLFHLAPA